MPEQPDVPGGSHDPTRANDPIDPTRAQDPVDPTRVQPGVDATRAQPAADRASAPLADGPRRRDPGDDDRTAWWLWGLLGAVLIAIVLFALLRESDDGDDTVDTIDPAVTDTSVADTTAPEDTAADTAPETTVPEDTATDPADSEGTTDTTVGGESGAQTTDDPGTVTTADGTDLFTLVEGDAGDAERLEPHAGSDVTGEGVFVLEIVDGEGFWIGADDRRRLFAHAADGVAVVAGQRISFDGMLKPHPPEGSAEVHDISEDEGAALYEQQGHHLELRSITAAPA